MSSLQETTIMQYKAAFPNDKLRNISEKTSIQITRVFRILNGSEMKISEYEAFQKCLPVNQQYEKLNIVIKKFLSIANPRTLKKFQLKMEHNINLHELGKSNLLILSETGEAL